MGEENDDIEALTAEIEDLRRRVDDLSRNVMIWSVLIILVSMLVVVLSLSGFNFIAIIIMATIFLMVLVCLRSLEQHGL